MVCKKYTWCLLTLIMVVTFSLRVYHLPEYPYHEDELGSIGVMQSIAEAGLPLNGDKIYWRSLLGHYLMALPLLFVDASPYSTRLVTTLFSVLLLPLAFQIAKQLQGRLAAWGVVAFLVVSGFQNHFAAFARFYGLFQFFFLLSVWLAACYALNSGPKRAGLWLCLSMIAAFATHKLGLVLWPVVGLALLLGRRWDLLCKLYFWCGFLICVVASWGLNLWTPESAYRNVMALSEGVGGYVNHWVYLDWFRRFVPGGLCGLLLCFGPLLHRQRAWCFYSLSFGGGLFMVSMMAPSNNFRYMAHLLPLGAIVAICAIVWWGQLLYAMFAKHIAFSVRTSLASVTVLFAAIAVLVTYDKFEPSLAFGFNVHFPDQKPAHEFLLTNMKETDVLLSVDPAFTQFYLRKSPDYVLREKLLSRQPPQWGPYPDSLAVGAGRKLVDAPGKLNAILSKAGGDVWIFTNSKIKWAIGPAMRRLIQANFQPVYRKGDIMVLKTMQDSHFRRPRLMPSREQTHVTDEDP